MQNFSEKKFPIIDLGDFILREMQIEDAQDFFNYYADPEVNKHILCSIPQNLEETKREIDYWRNIFYYNDGIYFAIATKKENKMIGSIGFTGHNRYNSRIEISYDLAKEYWRQGITKKSINTLIEYGFNTIGVNRIEAFTSVENLPSVKLLLSCNFSLEGTLRKHRFHKGEYLDVFSFGLLKSDVFKESES
jgi:ribosomal-protein-alanine N-acetyltransferase